jgi:cyclohexa-1,5-dienecarbonyl-CoA hydratase
VSGRIHVRSDGRLGRITLAAGSLNILDTDDVRALERAINELDGQPVILLDAAGDRAFSAGMDVADHSPDRAPALLAALAEMAAAFRTASSVTVAKVAAPALGGGFELVLLCDLAVCSERATFALPEIKLAALPPIACSLLPAAVGERRALDLILTGRKLDAATAEQWGIVSRAVTHDALDEQVSELCGVLLSLSEDALRCCKWATRSRDVGAALRIYTDDLLHTRDAAEGIQSFVERRAPTWNWLHELEEVAP